MGRVGIYEIAPLVGEASNAIRKRAGEPELLAAVRATGFVTMFEEGIMKAARGETSLSEVFRVIGPVDPETDGLDHSAETEMAPV
jgi:general secretion pathway protein E